MLNKFPKYEMCLLDFTLLQHKGNLSYYANF